MNFRLLAATAAVLLCGIAAHAQPSGLPDMAQHEISRRGSHVEQTGTIRSGLMAAALNPPADDSAKWFLTLVVRHGQRESVSMITTIANDPAMHPWVDTREPAKSFFHYQIRSVDDATQAGWLEGLRPALARSGVPLIVLQPPKNGQFGSSSTIVKVLSGVLTGDELSKKLREAMITYVDAIQPRGISQTVIGNGPAPFAVVPQQPVQPVQPVQPLVPFEFPQTGPPSQPTVVPTNPQVPAPSLPTTSLANLVIPIGIFAAGWIAANVWPAIVALWTVARKAIKDQKNAS